MLNSISNTITPSFEIIFEKIYMLETIIKLTLICCSNKELKGEYYDLSDKNIINLSEERNNYINMLTIALEKLEQLKKDNLVIEKDFANYNSTPTIAADK